MEYTQANYNLAVARLNVLLEACSKMGSAEDIEVMHLGRFIEDFETQRCGTAFEPYYIEAAKL